MRRKGFVAFFLVILSAAKSLAADATGDYSASAITAKWAIGDWGTACGPRPTGGGEPPGTFRVTQQGSELSLSGARAYKTTTCWETMPGLRVTSHSAGADRITTVCQMPAGDPRKTKITTTWTLVGDKLYFDEVGQYQFTLSEQNCSASSRRTRVLTRIVPLAAEPTPPSGEKASVPALATAPEVPVKKEPPPPSSGAQCKTRGPATSIVLSPKTKLMLPGETFSFRVTALDARRCEVSVNPRFSLDGEVPGLSVSPSGRVSVAGDAPSSRAILRVQAGETSLEAYIKIVSRAEYEVLLGGGNFSEAGESLDDVQVSRALVTLAPEMESQRSVGLWVSAALGFVTLLGGGLWLSKRRQSRPSANGFETPDETPAAAPPTSKICPICGQIYGPEATFCGSDGALLLRKN